MVLRRGIPILDLLPQTSDPAAFVPDDVLERIGVLTVLEHRATVSPDFFLHEGVLHSLAGALGIETAGWAIQIPGLTQGLPFRLALERTAALAGGQEGGVRSWTLDIQAHDVAVQLPFVRGARKAGGSGVEPLHLEHLPENDPNIDHRVFLVAQAVLRLSGAPGEETRVQLVDAPDPFDPFAPTGAVIRLTARPPSFTFGDSQYGMTLERFVIDLSGSFTPPDIVARGHDETWEGVSFKETTFYFPPVRKSLSISARDVIAGDPGGIQGELRVEWGADRADVFNTHVHVFRQQESGPEIEVGPAAPPGRETTLRYVIAPDAPGRPVRVRARFDLGTMIPGHTDLAVVGVWWRLPTGEEGNSGTTPYFDGPTTTPLQFRLRLGDPAATAAAPARPSDVPEGQVELTEVKLVFEAGAAPSGIAPLIDAIVGTETFHNVVHLRGPRDRIAGVRLVNRGAVTGSWGISSGSVPPGGTVGSEITLPMLAQDATQVDVLMASNNDLRRVRIQVTRSGSLVVGNQASDAVAAPGVVTVAGSGLASPKRVLDTFKAEDFHDRLEKMPIGTAATISGTNVTVPQGAVAEVEVEVPAGATDPLPAPPPTPAAIRMAQVLFQFDQALPDKVVLVGGGSPVGGAGAHEPDALPIVSSTDDRNPLAGETHDARIAAWLGSPPAPATRQFFIVGRTDDLKYNANEAGNNDYNDVLARDRMEAARLLLHNAGVPDSQIRAWIESAGPPSGTTLPPDAPPRFSTAGRLALPASQIRRGTGGRPVWNGRWTADGSSSSTHTGARDDQRRALYRCAEILYFDPGSTPTPPPPPPDPGKVSVGILVPGRDGQPPPDRDPSSGESPPVDYRVRIRVKWDSPTYVTIADAIPTEAELLVAWKAAAVELPPTASGGSTTPPTLPKPTGPDFWELLAHWTYDARSGQTEFTGALSLPDGALVWRSDALAGALAFGPAFAALVDPADVVSAPRAGFVGAAALITIGAAVGELLNSGSGPESTVDIDRFAIQYRWNGSTTVAATVDYSVDLRIDVSISGAGSLTGRIKLKYQGVGLRFEADGEGLTGIALTYDGLSIDVVDPGQWSLGGPLGNLIRVASSRIGNGSTWMEFDLEFAVDLGVVRLEGATVRLELEPFSVELRGLTASIDIPGVLVGRGAVTIGDGGAFRALLMLEIVPARIGAYGALAVDEDFVAVEVGVQFPVGIPLGNTGLGLFGLMGRFVANGARNLDGLTNPDPVQRELDWYVRRADLKYSRRSGQYALGVGAVIGTLPDGGFTFNAEGSLALGFPDVSVVFGIDAKLLSERKPAAAEDGELPPASLRILGVTVFEPDAIDIGVRASYEIPHVLKLEVPISAHFPIAATGGAWFIRIGTDNAPSRPGSPVTITFMPGFLDVRAWAFILIEERELLGLGGSLVPSNVVDHLDFTGFAIGMGAGFDLRWTAGPFKLEISAFLLVGIGSDPMVFAGAAGVRGELDLVAVSVGVDGLIHFRITDGVRYVDGHFCGRVSFFFFSISGCVDVRIGSEPTEDLPAPPSPLIGVDLVDHLAAVKGTAAPFATGTLPTVWPDTVAVLKFSHYVEDALGTGSDFVRLVAPTAALSAWSGATELRYAFRLTTLRLFRLTGTDPNSDASWTAVGGPFDSAWWLPSHRQGVITGGTSVPPSTQEGRELGVFHWDPRPWSRWLGEGSQDLPGDPAGTVGEACEPPRPAAESCALGRDATTSIDPLARMAARPDPGEPFPSRFGVRARLADGLSADVVAGLASDRGWAYAPGAVAPLGASVTVAGTVVTDGWRLPAMREGPFLVGTLPVELRTTKALHAGDLVLHVCQGEKPAEVEPGDACDTMPEETGQTSSFVGQSGTKYGGTPFDVIRLDGEPAVVVAFDLRASFPQPVERVQVNVAVGERPVKLFALDANDDVLTSVTLEQPGRQNAIVAAPKIASLVLESDGKPFVFRYCFGSGDPDPLPGIFEDRRQEFAPLVTALDRQGGAKELAGRPFEGADPNQRRCRSIAFRLPPRDPGDPAGGWTRLEIRPWALGNVSVVALCGVTLEAAAAQQDDGDFRDSLLDLFGQLVDLGTSGQPTHNVYLEPATTYQLRAGWEWQGFRPADAGDEPDPPVPSAWEAGGVDRWTFRTAPIGRAARPARAHLATLGTDPAQGGPSYDERVFDPRGLARFLTRAAPDVDDPPHFLDDPVGFWFMADHLESLVGKYERVLQAKVLRTDPAPGALHGVPEPPSGGPHPLDVTISTSFELNKLTWFETDLRFVDAIEALPCGPGRPPTGGSSISVTADLDPHAEYDLLLAVVPQVVGAHPEVVVARTHFDTSRYRNPTGMLAALGFGSPGIRPPTDAIVAGTVAPGALDIGDAALDAALTTLGMDPWPLPAAPRTTVLWQRPANPGDPWQVVGALVEADEPVWRAGFRTGAAGEPEPPPRLEVASLSVRRTFERRRPIFPLPFPFPRRPRGFVTITTTADLGTLQERIRNAAGTRMLFVPAAPIAVSGGFAYDLQLAFRERGAGGASGTALLFDRPASVFGEGE